MMPGASLSLTEIVHFRHGGYPPNGGRTHGEKGEPLIQPQSSNLAIGTASLPARGRLPFLATKILPARFGGLVPRPRLVPIFAELPATPPAALKAPGAFGKSSLAPPFARAPQRSGTRC